ncbi:proline---tRNA ligase [Powellomyces hirtus]|uniref:proline--tRNA ligase n=1 Tax=Powellomyces hirtus TaxID=109895 RepID=A0A507E4G7_9FUNG|nr:proline---tRNA ligase [Powellomyces hirtus]
MGPSLKDLLSAHPSVTHTLKSHDATTDLPTWISVVTNLNAIAAKTVVYKVKGASIKGDHYAAVVALFTSDVPAGVVAKTAGAKEGRVIGEDVATKLFGVARKDVTPFHLPAVTDKSALTVIVDSRLLAIPDDKTVAFRACADDTSLLIAAPRLQEFLEKAQIEFTTVEFAVAGDKPVKSEAVPKKPVEKQAKKPAAKAAADATTENKELIGLTVRKEEDFPVWYQQVLTRTEMMDYYDISGCYIIRPWAYKIWKSIQRFFGDAIEESGVDDCYFPMFVSEKALNREKDHVEGFSPEVAWVTKAGQSDLAEPIAVRPTSETVMYPYYASWIRSHRDLPLRLNQWCNVVRWEFKHPQPFLRTREFLWQEGHTAFATKEEADAEVREILELYRRVYEELLAVPVVPGVKSEKEKFAGGLYTTTVEGFIPTTGRAIQGATSHCLGQNFSKMFEILIENEAKERVNVWQNSWGLTTRTIGVMVMIHGDDKGLVLPPRVASIQAVVIPVGITAKTTQEERKALAAKADELVKILHKGGIRAKSDTRDNYTPGWKYNHWELKGVPVRLEIGPKDLANNSTRAVVRHNGTSQNISLATLVPDLTTLLDTIQSSMFAKAKQQRDAQTVRLETWDKFVESLNNKCLVLAPWCERVVCEDAVKENSARPDPANTEEVDDKAPSMGAKTLCIPFTQPEDGVKPGVTKCFACEEKAKSYTLWGRSY